LEHGFSDMLDDPGDLRLGIAVKGVARTLGGALLRALAPGGEPFGIGPVEEQRPPEQLLDRRLVLGPQRGDDLA
jgi:hypothetical protein